MSTRHKHRRVWAGGNVIKEAILATKPVHEDDQSHLSLAVLLCIDAISKGDGNIGHFLSINNACNVVAALMKQGIGDEHVPVVERAQAAIIRTYERYQRTGKFGFTAPDLDAVRGLMPVHDALLAAASLAEVNRALAYIEHRIKKGEHVQGARA